MKCPKCQHENPAELALHLGRGLEGLESELQDALQGSGRQGAIPPLTVVLAQLGRDAEAAEMLE